MEMNRNNNNNHNLVSSTGIIDTMRKSYSLEVWKIMIENNKGSKKVIITYAG